MTLSSSPLLTIITVVKDSVKDIEQTIQSVVALKTPEIEFIVLDGGSTDGTLSIIEQYAHSIDYWHSRPDRGIYYALNSAISRAHGTYILTINAGDQLLKFPREHLLRARDEKIELLCFSVLTDENEIATPLWSDDLKRYNTLPHQGCCYHIDLFEQYRYDIRYRVFSDFDLNQRLLMSDIRCQTSAEVIAFHDLQGVSNNRKYSPEMFRLVRRNFGWYGQLRSWLYFKKAGMKQRIKRFRKRTLNS